MNIEDVEGIGPEHAASLRGAGVATTESLLERGATAEGREELAAATAVSPRLVLEWVNHVDLMRLDGVGSEYADLLEAAGVDSPAELAQRNAANLAQTFQELDAARPNWIRNLPSQATVERWIAEAQALPKIVSHGGGGGDRGGGGDGRGDGAREAQVRGGIDAPESGQDEPAPPVASTSTAEPSRRSEAPETEASLAPPRAAARETAGSGAAGADGGIWARIKRMFGG